MAHIAYRSKTCIWGVDENQFQHAVRALIAEAYRRAQHKPGYADQMNLLKAYLGFSSAVPETGKQTLLP